LFTLEGIGEQIVHLSLSRLNVIDIVVLGQFVPILMDQRFVTGRFAFVVKAAYLFF